MTGHSQEAIINKEDTMRTIIYYLVAILILSGVEVYGVDLSKFKYKSGELEKYRLPPQRRTVCYQLNSVEFIRDEVKKIKGMRLSDDELKEIINSDELETGTGIAALRIWVKRHGKEIIPELIKMREYFYQKLYEPTRRKYWVEMISHINRCIVELEIRGMSCKDKIEYLINQKYSGIFPAVLNICEKEEGFEDFIVKLYNSLDEDRKETLIYELSKGKTKIGKKFVDEILANINKYNDKLLLAGANSCIVYYEREYCIDVIKNLRMKFIDDKRLIEYLNDLLKALMNTKYPLDTRYPTNIILNWVEEEPIDFGE